MAVDHQAALAIVEGRINAPFVWGSDANDCISFMAAVVRAYCGYDPIHGLHWSDEAEGAAVIAGLGGFEAAISSRLTPIAPAMASRWDVALVETAAGPLAMVVEGAMLVGPGPTRQRRLPRKMMVKAWTASGWSA